MAKKNEVATKVVKPEDVDTVDPATVVPQTLDELFTSDHVKNALATAAPKHLDVDRFVRICNTAIAKNPDLRKCTVLSFWNCMIQLSSIGLEPDGRRAHLIPYAKECTLIIDYKGIVEVITRSPDVSFIHAELVCDNDIFEYDRGQVTVHKIDFKEDRGEAYAVYSHAKLADGNDLYEVMTKADIEKVRSKSKSYTYAVGKNKKDSIWHEWTDRMWKKSVIRRHSNMLPMPSEVQEAVVADDHHQYDMSIQKTISADNLLEVPNGTRVALTAPESEPEAEPEPAVEPVAETVEPPADKDEPILPPDIDPAGNIKY